MRTVNYTSKCKLSLHVKYVDNKKNWPHIEVCTYIFWALPSLKTYSWGVFWLEEDVLTCTVVICCEIFLNICTNVKQIPYKYLNK